MENIIVICAVGQMYMIVMISNDISIWYVTLFNCNCRIGKQFLEDLDVCVFLAQNAQLDNLLIRYKRKSVLIKIVLTGLMCVHGQ